MSACAIVSGVLFKTPVEKTSKAGKPYLLATIKDGKGDAVRWWRAFIFAEQVCDDVRRLSDGKPIAVAGEINAEPYEKNGAQRLGWSIMVDAVLTARRPKVKPEDASSKPTANVRDRAGSSWASPTPGAVGGVPFNDDVPFAPEWR